MTIDLDQGSTADIHKIVNEWAIASGRLLLSKQTGFIHYYSGQLDSEIHHAIPLYENFLFVLALFKSRLVENIQEGKALLSRLLAFYNTEEGHFPVYLHDYPHCYDPTHSLSLIVPIYWILKQFGHVIGSSLKANLERIVHQLIVNVTENQNSSKWPYFLLVKWGAIKTAFAHMCHDDVKYKEGLEELKSLSAHQLSSWKSTRELSEILIALQTVYPSLANSCWSLIWKEVEKTWYPVTGCYSGPCVREWQDKEVPQASCYDLFLSVFSGSISKRIKDLKAYHLRGALIQPVLEHFLSPNYPVVATGTVEGQTWMSDSTPSYALTFLERINEIPPSIEKTFTPIRLIWGDLQKTHTLVCEGGLYTKATYQWNEKEISVLFELDSEEVDGDKEMQREIEFFIDLHPNVALKYKEKRTNTFSLDQELVLECEGLNVSLCFHLLEGKGDFSGHFMRGNRPSQIAAKGINRFVSYDWTLFLRSVRHTKCKILMTMKVQSMPSN